MPRRSRSHSPKDPPNDSRDRGHAKDDFLPLGKDDGIDHMASVLDHEEEELWKQLRRKREYELRCADKRDLLQELWDRRRKFACNAAEAKTAVDYCVEEILYAQEQERELQEDIAELVEANRSLAQVMAERELASQHGLHSAHGHRDPNVIKAEEKRRQDAIQQQCDQILSLRRYLDKLAAEKATLQPRTQLLFEKQRSAEQDRGRLLGTLADDRNMINEVRHERIRLHEERSRLEQELLELHGGGPGRMQPDNILYPVSPTSMSVPNSNPRASPTSGGVSPRTGDGRLGGRDDSNPFGGGGSFPGGSYGGGSGRAHDNNLDVSFGDTAFGGAGGGITEWADKLRGPRVGANSGAANVGVNAGAF